MYIQKTESANKLKDPGRLPKIHLITFTFNLIVDKDSNDDRCCMSKSSRRYQKKNFLDITEYWYR